MEALFGAAPNIQISEALTQPDPVKPDSNDSNENGELSAKDESKGRQRKRRNRRNNDRRRRKKPSDEAKADDDAAQAEAVGAKSDSGEEPSSVSDAQSDQQSDMKVKPVPNEDTAPPAPQEATTAS